MHIEMEFQETERLDGSGIGLSYGLEVITVPSSLNSISPMSVTPFQLKKVLKLLFVGTNRDNPWRWKWFKNASMSENFLNWFATGWYEAH